MFLIIITKCNFFLNYRLLPGQPADCLLAVQDLFHNITEYSTYKHDMFLRILTDTNWELSRPAVVLLTDPYWRSDQPESRVALINHCVPVTKVLPNHLSINKWLWDTTVSGCKDRGDKHRTRISKTQIIKSETSQAHAHSVPHSG